ncbi:MarR family transcriptional regulator [Olsenella umbonata]|jgi:DNA-binding MarR family transcriptional regulator|uniref:MarR family transcriptional regulator n=2 Tax=Parafannyhessea umbonata TaxID=604330 RepID=A0A6N7WUZ5_9ACTN|nr:MarR family transcriptional regulator [Parafannyhessea umbonata]
MATAECRHATMRLEDQLCFPLYSCSKEVIRRYREPLARLGLTYTQYVVMMVLWECGQITERDLGRKVHLDSGTLAPLLKRLEGRGLVRRARDPRDWRRLRVTLTQEGADLEAQAADVADATTDWLGLTSEEETELETLLNKAIDNLERGMQ